MNRIAACLPLLLSTVHLFTAVTSAAEPASPSAKPAGENSLGMQFVRIPPGEFVRGSSPAEIDSLLKDYRSAKVHDWYLASPPSESPQRTIHITRPLDVAIHEVTVRQFRTVVMATQYKTDAERSSEGGFGIQNGKWTQSPQFNWSNLGFEMSPDLPVTNVSWNDATEFCKWLSRTEKVTSRLPTEAEWEYFCRAGTTTRFYWGDDLSLLNKHAWHSGNSDNRPHPVGRLQPNPWGLFDVQGNAYEYCLDRYSPKAYDSPATADPRGPEHGNDIVVRGASWGTLKIHCRSAFRGDAPRNHFNQRDGFRIVREVPGTP